ncbi:MAG: cell envelope integrity protein CreD [Pseudomonadota bacterium]
MLRSPGTRFIILGLLVLLMTIPVFFVGAIIDSRADYNRQTIRSVGLEWGGPQTLSGPLLVIPVEETVTVREKEPVIDPVTGLQELDSDEEPVFRLRAVERTQRRRSVFLYPEELNLSLNKTTQERSRGIFSVPVFTAKGAVDFKFKADKAKDVLVNNEVLLWDEAELRILVSNNRALRVEVELLADGRPIALEPLRTDHSSSGGLSAAIGDPRDVVLFDLSLGLNGADRLFFTPAGRDTLVSLTSDWPHPEFSGAFLPDTREVTEKGFTANWVIPHLARSFSQISREDQEPLARSQSSFGVSLYRPNDFYQKAYRAARYGVLFIGLTFLTIFLVEGRKEKPTHPVQYILIGLSQSVFFLMMLALAEQIGFAKAYLFAGGATVILITAFCASALKLGRRTLVIGVLLAVLYGVLYMILRTADYALLAGSILVFASLAGTMFATRNEDWYGAPGDKGRRGWFRSKGAVTQPPQEPLPQS